MPHVFVVASTWLHSSCRLPRSLWPSVCVCVCRGTQRQRPTCFATGSIFLARPFRRRSLASLALARGNEVSGTPYGRPLCVTLHCTVWYTYGTRVCARNSVCWDSNSLPYLATTPRGDRLFFLGLRCAPPSTHPPLEAHVAHVTTCLFRCSVRKGVLLLCLVDPPSPGGGGGWYATVSRGGGGVRHNNSSLLDGVCRWTSKIMRAPTTTTTPMPAKAKCLSLPHVMADVH